MNIIYTNFGDYAQSNFVKSPFYAIVLQLFLSIYMNTVKETKERRTFFLCGFNFFLVFSQRFAFIPVYLGYTFIILRNSFKNLEINKHQHVLYTIFLLCLFRFVQGKICFCNNYMYNIRSVSRLFLRVCSSPHRYAPDIKCELFNRFKSLFHYTIYDFSINNNIYIMTRPLTSNQVSFSKYNIKLALLKRKIIFRIMHKLYYIVNLLCFILIFSGTAI